MDARPSVLIVDDREEDRYLLRRVIRKSGYEGRTHEVASAAEAERFVAGYLATPNPVLLLLVDINLPGDNGFELVETLTTRHADAPLRYIICSSSNNPEDHRRVEERSMITDFLQKPVSTEDWYRVVQSLR